MEKTIQIVKVKPMDNARIAEIDHTLEAMQELVGGYIEAIPIDDEVVIVCNEEGKLHGLQPNRGLYYDGELADILFGTFFICAAPLDKGEFASLTDEQAEYYAAWFKHPEVFHWNGTKIISRKIGI